MPLGSLFLPARCSIPGEELPGAGPEHLKHRRLEELQLPTNSCPVLLW